MALKAPRLKDSNVIIRLARDKSEIAEANRLVCNNYIDEGYWDTDEPFHKNKHMHSDMRTVFVAEKRGEIIGTGSIVRDSREGLPVDKSYGDAIRRFRHQGERLAEVSALAIKKGYSEQRNLVIFLFKYIYQYAFYYAQVDRFLIAIIARHAPFYKSVYRFEEVPTRAKYGYVKPEFAPILLMLPLVEAHKIYHERYETGIANKAESYYRFMLVDEHPNLRFPDKAHMLRRREIDWVAHANLRELPLAV